MKRMKNSSSSNHPLLKTALFSAFALACVTARGQNSTLVFTELPNNGLNASFGSVALVHAGAEQIWDWTPPAGVPFTAGPQEAWIEPGSSTTAQTTYNNVFAGGSFSGVSGLVIISDTNNPTGTINIDGTVVSPWGAYGTAPLGVQFIDQGDVPSSTVPDASSTFALLGGALTLVGAMGRKSGKQAAYPKQPRPYPAQTQENMKLMKNRINRPLFKTALLSAFALACVTALAQNTLVFTEDPASPLGLTASFGTVTAITPPGASVQIWGWTPPANVPFMAGPQESWIEPGISSTAQTTYNDVFAASPSGVSGLLILSDTNVHTGTINIDGTLVNPWGGYGGAPLGVQFSDLGDLPPTSVPDGSSTLTLLGGVLTVVGAVGRKLRK